MSVVVRRRYGYLRSYHDHNDRLFASRGHVGTSHRTSVDLRLSTARPPIADQGYQGSCGGFGGCRLFAFAQRLTYGANPAEFEPSPAFAYWNARQYEGTTSYDFGSQPRDILKGLATYGCPPLVVMPYSDKVFNVKPSDLAYQTGANQKATNYFAIGASSDEAKTCLEEGFPFSIGMSLYTSFDTDETERTGIIPLPKRGERMVGGHFMTVVGYEQLRLRNYYIIDNSWGKVWGDQGSCYVPEELVLSSEIGDDRWTIRQVGQ